MQEIERKYLVKPELKNELNSLTHVAIRQGYIMDENGKTVRVRTKGEKGYLTIKGKSEGISRAEFEYEIPHADALALLDGFCNKELSKVRYLYPINGKTWEIDVFEGKLQGLIIAELELESEDEVVVLPEWIDREVSDDVRYYNSNLVGMALEDLG